MIIDTRNRRTPALGRWDDRKPLSRRQFTGFSGRIQVSHPNECVLRREQFARLRGPSLLAFLGPYLARALHNMAMGFLMRAILAAALAVLMIALAPPAASAVTPEEIVRLSKSGVSDEVILALVARDKTIFSVAPDDLVALKREGVSEAAVLAIIKSGRDEGEAAFAYQSAQAAADRAAAAWLAPNVVVIGHGPDRPNTGYRDSQPVSRRPWPLYETPGLSGEFVLPLRPSLCVAQVAPRPGHAGFRYMTECPAQLHRRTGRLPR